MRQALSVAIIAGAAAQFAGPAQPQAPSAPQGVQWAGASQVPSGSAPVVFQQSFATTPADGNGLTAQTRGIPVLTSSGVADSDVACWRGDRSLCGLPNIASIYNPNPTMQYQTQASDQALASLFATGQVAADGRRIVSGNAAADLGTNIIPYWTSGGFNNVQGAVTVAAGDAFRNPLGFQVNAVTNNPSAPNAVAPSASNAFLPQSSAFQFANMYPGMTTSFNTLTGAGAGYSTGLNTNLQFTNGANPAPIANWGGAANWGVPAATTNWGGANWGASPISWNAAPNWGVPAATNWGFPATNWASTPATNWAPTTNWGGAFNAPTFGTTFGAAAPAFRATAPTFTGGQFTNPGSFATAPGAPQAQAINFAANTAPNFAGTPLTTAPAWLNSYATGATTGVPAQAGQTFQSSSWRF